MQPNAPFFTPRSAELWRATQPVAALPLPEPVAAAPSLAYEIAWKALQVVAVLLLAVMALIFIVFSEDGPERVRPELTPEQRARAFRLPA